MDKVYTITLQDTETDTVAYLCPNYYVDLGTAKKAGAQLLVDVLADNADLSYFPTQVFYDGGRGAIAGYPHMVVDIHTMGQGGFKA